MCFDPISLSLMVAATAAQAGGQRLNQLAQNKAIKASVAAERGRQQAFQNEADQQFQGTLDRFKSDNMNKQIADTSLEREQTIAGNISGSNAEGDYQAATTDAPQVVRTTMAKRLSDAVAKSKDEAKRLAKLGSTGAVGFGNALAMGDTGRRLDTISGFSRGSLDTNMAEQAAAAQKRSGWGDALGLAGQGLSLYNMASAPGRSGGSMFGGGELKPVGAQYGPGQYSRFAQWQNLF